MAGAPVYIVHLSSEAALNEVRAARDRGLPAFAETCPQYLLLSIEELERPISRGEIRVHPAATREGKPAQALDGLKNDHLQVSPPIIARFVSKTKRCWQRRFHQDPNGGPASRIGCSDPSSRRQPGKLTLNRFVELVSTTPARIFGMYPAKACSRRAAMQTSLSGILRPSTPSAPNASHARGLLDVRRLSRERQRANGDVAR